MLDVTKLKIAGKINGRPVIYLHVLQFYCDHGYVPDRIGTTRDGILFDMAFGPPITDAQAVVNCRLFALLQRFPDITGRETEAIRAPIPDEVRDRVIAMFTMCGEFVPTGDAVADKTTGGIVLRRFIIERMVADGDLCYEDGCYRLT